MVTIATVVLIAVHVVLYLKGQVTATTLSNTMATVIHLLIFSADNAICIIDKDFTVQVRYSSGQKSWHKMKGIYTQLIVIVKMSATAKLLRYCNDVLESLTLKSTTKVRTFPRIPQLDIMGQTAQYRTDFSTAIWSLKMSFSDDVVFSNNAVEMFSGKLMSFSDDVVFSNNAVEMFSGKLSAVF